MARSVRGVHASAHLVVVLLTGLAAVLVGVSGAAPAAATTTETASFSGLACVTSSTTNTSSWGSATAPANAVFADFTIVGGGGAAGDSNAGSGGAGGAGSIVSGRVAVTPGQRIWARIGCGGTDAASFDDWNGRRAAGWSRGGPAEDFGGGGGGGATGLCIGTASGSCSGGTMVAIAGGGGGGARGSGTGACSDTSGGSGGNGSGGSNASAHSGTARGGGRGTQGSGSVPRGDGGAGGGGGGQGPGQNTGATTADNTGGAAGGDVGGATNGGSMGGTPPVDPGEGGAGGRGANGRNDITGGGGGGGYTGGGGGAGGEDGNCTWGNWNGGGGGGAGASWVRNTVTGFGFSAVSGTFSTCNDSLGGANVGKGANFGSGARGCHGNVTVTWVKNQPPTGAVATHSVTKQTPFAFTLAGSDPDGDNPVTCEVLSAPSVGTLAGSGCSRTYTAPAGSSGSPQLTYRVVDSQGVASATYAVSFAIANRNPAGEALARTATKGVPLAITFPVSDPDGDGLTCSIATAPGKGDLSGSGCSTTYTARPDTGGTDGFSYTVSDGLGGSSTHAVTITIANRAPTSAGQALSVAPGSATPITLGGSDPDGDETTCTTSAPSAGSLTTGTGCSRTYTAPSALGTYSFTYARADAFGGTSPSATVTVAVVSPDVAITKSHVGVFNDGTEGTYTIGVANVGNAPTVGTITVVDELPAGMTVASTDVGGSGFACDPGDGSTLVCTRTTPLAAGASTSLTLVVDVAEGAASATNTATVSATPDHDGSNDTASDPTTVNLRPTAGPVAVQTSVGTPVAVTLAGGDPEGEDLTYQVGTPSSGTLDGAAPDLTFTPEPGSDADVTVTYTVTDPYGHVSFVATVAITVIRPGVHGRVTSDATGAGIAGVTVRLYQDGVGYTAHAASTGADGRYDLGAGFGAGTYRVVFSDPTQAHVTEWWQDSVLRSTSAPLVLDPGEERDLSAALAPGAAIDVAITNAGAYTVALYDRAPTGASAFRSSAGVAGTTSFRGLPAGTYYVSVTDPSGALLAKWSGNQTIRAAAEGIAVATGATQAASFTLPAPNTISGTVEDTTGPLEGVTVQAYDATTGAYARAGRTDEDGEYAIRGVPAGSYKLVFRDPTGAHPVLWSGGAEVMGSAATVAMPVGGAVTVDSVLPRTGTLTGTVTGGPEGTTLLAGARVTLYRGAAVVRSVVTAADGTWTAAGLVAGEHTVLVGAAGHRSEYNLDRSRRADADPVALGPGTVVAIDATLSPS